MGILYSTYSYIASFAGYKTPKLNQTKITISANRLIHHLKLKELGLQKTTKEIENKLIQMINGEKMTRSAGAQQTVMSDIIMNSYLLCAYEELIICANIIKAEAKQLENDPGKVSPKCITAICTVLYCYDALHLQDCLKLDDLIPKPHPKIHQKYISQPLQEYVEYKKVDMFALNVYALEMCYRHKISLEKVNQGGHKFIYSPSKMKEQESRSSVMFALDIDMDEQMMEKQKQMMLAQQ